MKCPACNHDFTNPLEKFSIEHNNRCVDCQNRWIEEPENNPDYKTFQVDAKGYASFTVRALDRDDALERASEYVNEEADWDFDIKIK